MKFIINKTLSECIIVHPPPPPLKHPHTHFPFPPEQANAIHSLSVVFPLVPGSILASTWIQLITVSKLAHLTVRLDWRYLHSGRSSAAFEADCINITHALKINNTIAHSSYYVYRKTKFVCV